jgi:hypothetical protein
MFRRTKALERTSTDMTIEAEHLTPPPPERVRWRAHEAAVHLLALGP